MNKSEKSQSARITMPKSPRSTSIGIKVSLILLLFIFFWASPFLFSNLNEYLLTPIGKRMEIGTKRYVTLTSWTYSPSQKRMEIDLSMENLAYNGLDDYSFSCVSRGQSLKHYTVDTVLSSSDLVVVTIDGVADNFNEIKLEVHVVGGDGSVSLYSNRKDVERVSSIELLTETEYRITSLNRRVENITGDIETCKNSIEDAKVRIENINLKIQDLEASKAYQTASEILETNHTISQQKSLITTEEKNIEAWNSQIVEYESRIMLTKKEIEDLKAHQEGESDNEG